MHTLVATHTGKTIIPLDPIDQGRSLSDRKLHFDKMVRHTAVCIRITWQKRKKKENCLLNEMEPQTMLHMCLYFYRWITYEDGKMLSVCLVALIISLSF